MAYCCHTSKVKSAILSFSQGDASLLLQSCSGISCKGEHWGVVPVLLSKPRTQAESSSATATKLVWCCYHQGTLLILQMACRQEGRNKGAERASDQGLLRALQLHTMSWFSRGRGWGGIMREGSQIDPSLGDTKRCECDHGGTAKCGWKLRNWEGRKTIHNFFFGRREGGRVWMCFGVGHVICIWE